MAAAGALPHRSCEQVELADTETGFAQQESCTLQQAEARARLGDAKGAVAAYKRAVGEAASPDLALLQGLADVLAADARQQEAVDILSAQKPHQGVDDVDLQLLIGKVNMGASCPQPCMHASEDCLTGGCWGACRCTPSGRGMMHKHWQSTMGSSSSTPRTSGGMQPRACCCDGKARRAMLSGSLCKLAIMRRRRCAHWSTESLRLREGRSRLAIIRLIDEGPVSRHAP